jgi:hypothetical protein
MININQELKKLSLATFVRSQGVKNNTNVFLLNCKVAKWLITN